MNAGKCYAALICLILFLPESLSKLNKNDFKEFINILLDLRFKIF